MKKILLATTMLVGTAGFASAEISFSGSASAGVASNGLANGGLADPNATGLADETFFVYSTAGLDITFSGSSDNGVEFGSVFSLNTGRSYTLADDDGFADETSVDGMPTIYVSGSFGKIEFAADDYDFYDDANGSGDVQYTGTFGAISVGTIADLDTGNISAKADATFGGFGLHVDGDTYSEYNASASYTMGGFTGTVGAGQSDVDGSTWNVKGAYANGAMSASASYNDAEEIDLSFGYSANSISLGLDYGTDSDAATVDTYTLTAGYDLGGGLSVEAGYNYTGDAFVGAAMAF